MADHMKRTGPIVARQLKKHGQPRLQTLAMRRVRIAAWQMVRCRNDAKGRRNWEESTTRRFDGEWRGIHQTVQGGLLEQHATRFFGDAWISKLKACKTWAEWYSLKKDFEHSWHATCVCDALVERENRPRDDSDPWNVAWFIDEHRRLEILGDNKVVINWMNGAWEVKDEEHAVPVRGVVDQLVQWFLGGTFRPRTDETCWCRHIFRESNKAADTHANLLMDLGNAVGSA